MRKMKFVGVLIVAGLGASVASAQTPSPDAIVSEARAAFKTAKNAQERESITLWCKDNIAALNFKERDQLMVRAVRLMEENKIAEANELLKRVNSLKDLNENLGNMVCRPD